MQINDLKDFNLEENNISDPYVFYSSKFLSLETLNLSNNKIDEKDKEKFRKKLKNKNENLNLLL